MVQSNILRCHQICVQNGQSAYSIFKTLYADWAILETNLIISYFLNIRLLEGKWESFKWKNKIS
jgi:hypothetical protein